MLTNTDKVRGFYNCQDVLYTLEINTHQKELIENLPDKTKQFYSFQINELYPAINKIMNRGVKVDLKEKEKLLAQLNALKNSIELKLNDIIGEEFNPNSNLQIKKVFKDLLGIKPIVDKTTKSETFNNQAMVLYSVEYPLLRPLIYLLLEYRSIKVYTSTFLSAKVAEDGRMRTSYNIAGTSTYRLASRKNAFDEGMNMMNIPSKGKINLKYALELEINGQVNENYCLTNLPNCKKIFIPDTGYTFFDADLVGADAQIVAYESECTWLKEFFKSSDKKLYQYIAEQYYQTEISTDSKEYKVFKQFCHGCVTGDHEVLTKNGWINIEEYNINEELAVWEDRTSNIYFEVPKDFNEDYIEEDEDLYYIEGDSFSFLGTQDHKFPYKLSSGKIDKDQAVNLNKTARIPYSGEYIGGNKEVSENWVRLLVAFQADGTIDYTCKNGQTTITWHFKKQRKIDRLLKLLNSENIIYKKFETTEDSTKISVKGLFTKKHKILNWSILNLCQENLKVFVDELQYWDGHIRTSNGVRTSITTTLKETSEILQTVIHLTRKASKVNYNGRTGFSNKTIYDISINNRKFYRIENGKRGLVKHKGTKVYCPVTSTGYFMIRRNGNIYVSGNSNYGMGYVTAGKNANIPKKQAKELQKWYFTLCPEIPKWHNYIEECIKTKGFVENCFGARMYFINTNDPLLLNKAIASIPQSTIAILINKGIVNIEEKEKDTQVLIQVHDSAAGQFLTEDVKAPKRIKDLMEIPLYNNELVIPVEINTSIKSYGDC